MKPKYQFTNSGFTITYPDGTVQEIEIYEPHGAEYVEALDASLLFGHEEIIIVTKQEGRIWHTFTR